jgi:uncharacterized YigZ family protein
MTDEYRTLGGQCRAEMKVYGSRFIATALPVLTSAEAEQFISRIRKQYYDASHNCFAYRAGTDETRFRVSDAGEPAGSAGKAILGAIDRHGLSDVVVVVTRYFGGTKLGLGGLARAYGETAHQALCSGTVVTRYRVGSLTASFPHAQISNVMYVVSRLGARITDTSYDEEVHLKLEIRSSKLGELQSVLMDKTSGNITVRTP